MARDWRGTLVCIGVALDVLMGGCFQTVPNDALLDAGAHEGGRVGAGGGSALASQAVSCGASGSTNGVCDVLVDAAIVVSTPADASCLDQPNPCGPGVATRGAQSVVCDCSGTGYDGVFCDHAARACDDDDAGTCAAHAVSIDTRCGTTCVLLDDSSVRCWGQSNQGQVGDGSMISRTTPVAVHDLTGVQQVAVGCNLACALLQDGTVRCWGDSEVSDGSGHGSAIPVLVSGVSSATQIAAGDNQACARLQNGTVRCWGSGGDGALGNGSAGSEPVSVVATGLSHVARVACGFAQSYAWLDDGRLFAWGYNTNVQTLGTGTAIDQLVPIEVPLLSEVTQLALGYYDHCALRAAGTVDCWGLNESGALGRATPDGLTVYPTPTAVTGLTDVHALGSGFQHTCALMNDASVRCWGKNNHGQLGDGRKTDRFTPEPVAGLHDVLQVAGGQYHTCAVVTGGAVYCWGANDDGQLGIGSNDETATPTRVRGF